MKFRILEDKALKVYTPQVYDEKSKKYKDLGIWALSVSLDEAERACQFYKDVNEGKSVVKEFEL